MCVRRENIKLLFGGDKQREREKGGAVERGDRNAENTHTARGFSGIPITTDTDSEQGRLSKHQETGCSVSPRNLHEEIYVAKGGSSMARKPWQLSFGC